MIKNEYKPTGIDIETAETIFNTVKQICNSTDEIRVAYKKAEQLAEKYSDQKEKNTVFYMLGERITAISLGVKLVLL